MRSTVQTLSELQSLWFNGLDLLVWSTHMAEPDVSTQGSPKGVLKRKRKLKAMDSNAGDFIDIPEACASKPAGFVKESDFQDWPLHVVNSICKVDNPSDADQELSLRLQQHFLRGIVLNTAYSGIDGPREALELAARSINILHGVECVTGANAVTVGRTCDKGNVQKKIQVAMSQTHECGQHCHFEDLMDRLPPNGQAWVRAALPEKTDSKDVRAQAFNSISAWLMENRAWLFSLDATSWCSVHQRTVFSKWGKLKDWNLPPIVLQFSRKYIVIQFRFS